MQDHIFPRLFVLVNSPQLCKSGQQEYATVGIASKGHRYSGGEPSTFLSHESWPTVPLFQDPPEGFILNYTLLIGDDAYYNFQKVCDMFRMSWDKPQSWCFADPRSQRNPESRTGRTT